MAVIHAPGALAPAAHTHASGAPAVAAAPPIELLLVEPQFLVRRTVAAVARDLRLAHLHEQTSIEAAARLIDTRSFEALLLSVDEEADAIALMERVRDGATGCDAATPIAVTAGACSTSLALKLKALQVRRLLLRPFKVKAVLDAIVALRPEPLRTAA